MRWAGLNPAEPCYTGWERLDQTLTMNSRVKFDDDHTGVRRTV